MKKYILAVFICFASGSFLNLLFSQDLTGVWKGYFKSGSGETYKLEFQISHKKNAYAANGVSYSYLDIRFYGKATMTGNFIANGKNLRIKEIKTVEVKNSQGSGTCIMNYNLTYSKSGKEEFLEGTYLGMYESPNQKPDPFWGDCGSGKVVLRKVETSDFYPEPFLRKKATPNPPVANSKPTVKSPSTNNNSSIPKKATPPVVKQAPPKTEAPPLIQKEITPPKKEEIPAVKKELPVKSPAPPALLKRTNELTEILTINEKEVTVKLYDNGEVDNDTISVYLDHKLVLDAKRLSTEPLILKINLDENGTEHELVMVAENLGRIPPNTSLMIVEAGTQRFKVQITSTEQKNAVVRFRYVPK